VAAEIPAFDLYAELEVSERASVETIQAAYRSLQLRNHPDRAGPGAGDRAVRLNIARDWLTDTERRARYDAHLAELRRARIDAAEGADDDDVDEDDWEDDDEEDEGEEAGDEDEADEDGPGGAVGGGLGVLHLLRHHLRIDVRRLGRIWIVGLALLGIVALMPSVAAPTPLRIGIAVVAVLALTVLALGIGRSTEGAGMSGLMARWIGILLGWIVLAVLAAEGVQAIVQLLGGERTPAGIAEIAGPVLALTAVASVLAVRRRHGPVETSVDEFLSMTPREFELEVGRILGRHGYRLTLTGGPGDLAADLTGTDPDGRPTVVQCKRYAPGHPVGSRDVQLLMAMGVRHHKAERLVLVTTSDFTDPARDLADEHGVDLISGEELEDLTR
jgi:restriction system protein